MAVAGAIVVNSYVMLAYLLNTCTPTATDKLRPTSRERPRPVAG
jgi:hypothetical protein